MKLLSEVSFMYILKLFIRKFLLDLIQKSVYIGNVYKKIKLSKLNFFYKLLNSDKNQLHKTFAIKKLITSKF